MVGSVRSKLCYNKEKVTSTDQCAEGHGFAVELLASKEPPNYLLFQMSSTRR